MTNRSLTTTALSVTVAPTARRAGELLAAEILDAVETTPPPRPFVLACPAGRSPAETYAALARRATDAEPDLSRLHIALVDEYVVAGRDGMVLCDADAHYSCRRFVHEHLLSPLERALPADRRVRRVNVHTPDPADAGAFDARLESLGGIDILVLASGASDGHVAFNPPGSSPGEGTRVVAIADTTRRDNLATFPAFGGIDEVPTDGVTIGLRTVLSARRVVLLMVGTDKAPAFERLLACGGFDPSWPASIVHLCRDAHVIVDEAAASSS